jgi:hypothetical protein
MLVLAGKEKKHIECMLPECTKYLSYPDGYDFDVDEFFDASKCDDGSISNEKPPLGLMPKYIHDEKRVISICNAIIRYTAKGKKVPNEWLWELCDLLEKAKVKDGDK